MNITENLKIAAEILHSNEIPEARREANSLLAFALEKDKTFLVAHSEYELSADEEKRFQNIIQRRARREPFQYIVGKQEFFGLDFAVTKDVLIPRPETETIVEQAINILEKIENPKFCEIGVGSGCISVSILHNVKQAFGKALDISQKALNVARSNAEKHRVSARLEFDISDVFSVLADEKFDLIVSNPPYIAEKDLENLQPEVRDYEPLTALTDGKNGLSIVERIIKESPLFLNENGFLLMEIGFDQAEMVEPMFEKSVWQTIEILQDFQGILRTVKAKRL